MFDGLGTLIQTNLTDVVTDLLPVVGLIVGVFVAIKIVKRFIGR